jgi:DNA-binding NarL/FixJ family response regulator
VTVRAKERGVSVQGKRKRRGAGADKRRQSALRILIAHDEEIVRIGIHALLKGRRRWKICGEVTTGREAVEKVAKLKPNVLVLKLDLPDCSGLDVIPAVLKIRPDVKILLLATEDSAIAARRAVLSPTTARHALNEGALGLVLKPDANDFVLALDSLSRNRPFVSANITEGIASELAHRTGTLSVSSKLTPRESEVLKLVALGKPSKDIARDMGISSKTVDVHRANVMRKLGFRSQTDLLLYAIRHKVIELPEPSNSLASWPA